MLSYARQKAVAANATNIEFYHAGFLTYEHTANAADFIVTTYATGTAIMFVVSAKSA
jgi:ubiquinone/menaquinone biosynthesis C-methylase UbiE